MRLFNLKVLWKFAPTVLDKTVKRVTEINVHTPVQGAGLRGQVRLLNTAHQSCSHETLLSIKRGFNTPTHCNLNTNDTIMVKTTARSLKHQDTDE